MTGGRLLRSIDRHGRIGAPLSGDAVDDIVRAAAHRAAAAGARLYPAGYSAHSLRAGGATIAARAQVPVSVIAEHGRRRPGSPVVLSYIRAVDRWRDNAMRGVGL